MTRLDERVFKKCPTCNRVESKEGKVIFQCDTCFKAIDKKEHEIISLLVRWKNRDDNYEDNHFCNVKCMLQFNRNWDAVDYVNLGNFPIPDWLELRRLLK